MKVLVIVFLWIGSLYAAPIWTSYTQGEALIKKSHGMMMVMISSPTCHYCTQMEQETLADPKVLSLLSRHFVCVKLMKGSDLIPAPFRTSGTPTFFFVDEHQRLIVPKIFGAWQSHDFIDILQTIITHHTKGQR